MSRSHDKLILLSLLEVAPPGREPQVRKLKGKVDNPYAVAWASYNAGKAKRRGKKKKEANSSGGLPQTLRGGKNKKQEAERVYWQKFLEEKPQQTHKFFESMRCLEAVAAPAQTDITAPPEGPIVKCVLITEGLGNRADMHYYGPECIKTGAPLFEGKPCFLDHQSRFDSQDRPERTVRDKCGYFKNVRSEMVGDRLGLVAELHFDLSETGKMGYDKACTAIHYKTEMIDAREEYVGLSIAADGKLEERTVQVDGEILDVKYVTQFTQVGSVDEVTSPARGGKFVQVLKR